MELRIPRSTTHRTSPSLGRGRIKQAIQTTIFRATPLLFMVLLYTTPVLAQSGEAQGGTLCSTDGYNFFVGLAYLVMGLSVLAIVVAIFSGGAAKAFGFISSRVSRAGNTALVGGMASFGLIALTLGVAGVAFGVVPVDIPTECVTFF